MLKRARIAIAAALLALAPGLLSAEPLNLLVMGEDGDPESIRRHTPVFERVLPAIAGELRARGLAVYDETAVTLDFYDQTRVNRSDAELISLARTVQIAPIDAVTAFEIQASIEDSIYEGIQDLRLRIFGRVVHVDTGRLLGGYEVSYTPGDLPPAPLDCHRTCLMGFVGDQAALIAKDVGAALAAQLTNVPGAEVPATANSCDSAPNAYTLTFTDFTANEMTRVETFLAAFHGYVHHRVLNADDAKRDVRYETCADADRLERNLRVMFEQTGLEVWIEGEGQDLSVAKIGPPAAQ
jgi:hypothetical protein